MKKRLAKPKHQIGNFIDFLKNFFFCIFATYLFHLNFLTISKVVIHTNWLLIDIRTFRFFQYFFFFFLLYDNFKSNFAIVVLPNCLAIRKSIQFKIKYKLPFNFLFCVWVHCDSKLNQNYNTLSMHIVIIICLTSINLFRFYVISCYLFFLFLFLCLSLDILVFFFPSVNKVS